MNFFILVRSSQPQGVSSVSLGAENKHLLPLLKRRIHYLNNSEEFNLFKLSVMYIVTDAK